jgi:MFS family permease
MSVAAQPTSPIRAVLANRNFRFLWIGQTISQIGDGLTNLALLIVINQLTGSSAALAVMMVVIAVPQLIFGLVSGVLVDRWDRRRVMIISDILRGLLVLGFILVRRPEQIWIFYVLGFLQAAVGTFFNPARTALMPNLLERDELLTANAFAQTTQVITAVIGSALAGVLVGVAGSAWPAFLLDGLSFFLSALFVLRIAAPRAAGLEAGGLRETVSQLGQGIQYLFSRRLLMGLILTFAVTMLGLGAVNVLIIPFLVNLLQAPTETLGIFDAAQVAGMILGGGLLAALAARLKTNQIIGIGMLLVGLFVGLFGASQTILMTLVCMFFIGLFIAPVQSTATTILQQTIPDDIRGRASSAMNTTISLANVVSMACAGWLGDQLGIRPVFWLAGGLTLCASLLAVVMMREPAQAPGAANTGEPTD